MPDSLVESTRLPGGTYLDSRDQTWNHGRGAVSHGFPFSSPKLSQNPHSFQWTARTSTSEPSPSELSIPSSMAQAITPACPLLMLWMTKSAIQTPYSKVAMYVWM